MQENKFTFGIDKKKTLNHKVYQCDLLNTKKLDKILNRYEILKDDRGKKMMENLLIACESLMNESWFDDLSATIVIRFLAEIAEADHKIEETEIQLLNNLADVFGIKPPRI